MPQWQFRAVMAVCAVVTLLPLTLCLSLWKHLHKELIGGWRRVVSGIGLGMATAASLVPPLWLIAMVLLSRTKDSNESPVLGAMLDAVFIGLVLAIFAAIALCFAKGRVRWMGTTACAVIVVLVLLSFAMPFPSVSVLP
jgi:chromate transport protein ChrA